MAFRVTKTYGHERGFSTCFRQPQADSHCSQLHGYALSIALTFEAHKLLNHWVIDFGALKSAEGWLRETFDHTLLVSFDDPERDLLETLGRRGIARVNVVHAIGCEAFALLIYNYVSLWLEENRHSPRVRLAQVDVAEHGANCASYVPPRPRPAHKLEGDRR